MKKGAYFVTTARGGIHDEAALAVALDKQQIAGAGLDVWEDEPPPHDNPLMAYDNVLVSPHTAGGTGEARENMSRYAAEQERVRARIALLEREIKTEVEGAMATVELGRKASASLETELAQPAEELIRIARVAYDEGEAGVLEVLDALRLRRNAGLKKLEMDAALREAFLELERAVGEELEVLR